MPHRDPLPGPGAPLAGREQWSGLEPAEQAALQNLRAAYLLALRHADESLAAERS